MIPTSTLPTRRPRQGIALPLVLICLVLIGAMGVVVLRTVLLEVLTTSITVFEIRSVPL